MYVPRILLEHLPHLVQPGKVVVVYGPRRSGKTTLLKTYMETLDTPVLFVTGEDIVVRQYLESQSIQKLSDFIGRHTLLLVDEAQYVRQIGLNLKLLVDHVPGLRILATGSSSFELAKDVGEPLTGRKTVLQLLPFAQMELCAVETIHETEARLESRLIFGSYPEVVLLEGNLERETYLRELVSSYLFKDILQLEGIRHSDKLHRLLQLLAFQIGREVSLSELGTHLGMNKLTVERYLDLLEKTFVIFRRGGFSRNLRKEVVKNGRYYFLDNGIRNALINNFNPILLRNDVGELWENYIVTERLKMNAYRRRFVNTWFWRTYDRQEIDLVEEHQGRIEGFEIKWKPHPSERPPSAWKQAYEDAGYKVIHPRNYLPFIGCTDACPV